MRYYWILVIIYLFFLKVIFRDIKNDKRRQRNFIILALLPIFFLMALRNPYSYTGDVYNYHRYFMNVGKTNWANIFSLIDRFEVGYVVLNKILYTICPWDQAIIVFEAAFCLISVGIFIYRNTDQPFYSILAYMSLGIMNMQMTGFRQGLAISMLMYSVEFIKRKKVVRFAIIVVLAALFHKTSIIFLFAYFVLNRRLSIPWQIVLAGFTVAAGYFMGIILKFSIDLFELDEYSLGYPGSIFGGIVMIIFFISVLIISFINNNRKTKKEDYLFLNMTEVGVFIYILRYIALSMERISLYFSFGFINALPNTLDEVENLTVRDLLKIAYSLVMSMYLIYTASYSPWGKFVPFWK